MGTGKRTRSQKRGAAEKDGELKDVSKERPNRIWVFQAYKRQHESTKAAVQKNPCFDLDDSGVKGNVIELFRKMKMDSGYRHLRDKVIFGVDWYLSLITKAPEYKEYVESFFDIMSEFDEWQWYRSALVNPAMFYGLDKPDLIENIYSALKKGNSNKEKSTNGYKRISILPQQIETIRIELERAHK